MTQFLGLGIENTAFPPKDEKDSLLKKQEREWNARFDSHFHKFRNGQGEIFEDTLRSPRFDDSFHDREFQVQTSQQALTSNDIGFVNI